jgi:lipopolysaccharide export system protein LptA
MGAILLLLTTGAIVAAQDVLKLSRNDPGDTKPITLYADEVSTWKEDGKRVVLLKGLVLVEHGTSSVRCEQAIVWIDDDRYRQTHIWSIHVQAEGSVTLESGDKIDRGAQASVDLNTRGELRFKAKNGKIIQQPRTDDPFYQKVTAQRLPAVPAKPAAPPTPPVQRTGYFPATQPVPTPTAPAQAIPSSGAQGVPPPPVAPGPVTPPAAPPGPMGAAPPPTSPPPMQLTPGASAPGASFAPPSVAAPVPVPAGDVPPPPGMPLPPRPSAVLAGPAPRPAGPPRFISIRPRTSVAFSVQTYPLPNGEQAVVVTGGISLTVRNLQGGGLVDMEADRLVIWTKRDGNELVGAMTRPEGEPSREQEFYLAGNVELRQQFNKDNRTIHADQLYYDVNRNVAVAVSAELEFTQPGVTDPIHLKADELNQLSLTTFEAVHAEIFSSKLPSDPGLKIYVSNATLETKKIPRRSIFGWKVVDPRTGEPVIYEEQLVRSRNAIVELENIPIFYTPYLQGDASDPLGPLTNINIGYNQNVFGVQFDASFDAYNLLGLVPAPGTRWRFDIDYLSLRGPGLGTDFSYGGQRAFDIPNNYAGSISTWGIIDHGTDVLGGGRGEGEPHPEDRGRFTWRQSFFDLPYGFSVLTGLSALSDHNFLEQYYKNEFDTGIDQQTFIYVKQQQDNWAWTGIVEPRIRNWVTETEKLPAFDGWLIGQSFWDRLTLNSHASAGYYQLRPANVTPPEVEPTRAQSVNTARFDWMNELSMPLSLGPVKVVPYGILDTTYYTQDLAGNDRGRFYIAGGVRDSMSLTHIYPTVSSDLFNLQGINHKIVLSSNFFAAHSDTPMTSLPLLDTLNDDATDQALNDIRPAEPTFNPKYGQQLATNTLYDPQYFALRNLLMTSTETLDSIEELQFDIRQRLQTKRGYPGAEHIIDWMTLDMSATYFPHPSRDNFDTSWAFLQYDYLWNIGDRTAFASSGWVDPISNGAREFTLGLFLNRPDRTNFYIGYRQLDPLQSRAVTGAVTYVFSPKYSVTGSSTCDFGTGQSLSNSLVLTRIGSDVQVSIEITYNALQNNFGGSLLIVPNLLASKRVPGFGSGTAAGLLGH